MTDRWDRRWILGASAILPGAGHVAVGERKTGFLIILAFFFHLGILFLACLRKQLVWMERAGRGDSFSTIAIFSLLALIWTLPLLNLWRKAKRTENREERRLQEYWSTATHYILNNKKGLMGVVILLVIVYMAFFASFFAPYNSLKMNLIDTLVRPSRAHPLGTDNFGRDILSRVIYGSRVALGIGAAATLFNMILGGFLGLIGGYFGGVVDVIVMRLLEAINSIPFIVLAILVISIFGSGALNLVLVLGVFGLQPARIIRSKVLAIRKEIYIEASRATGANNFRIIFHHILPNSMAPLLVVTTMMIGTNIITVAGLSFLGFGIKPPTPSWGAMLQQAQEYMRVAWWMAVFPGIAIFLTVFGFNILGDALRDALDPKLR